MSCDVDRCIMYRRPIVCVNKTRRLLLFFFFGRQRRASSFSEGIPSVAEDRDVIGVTERRRQVVDGGWPREAVNDNMCDFSLMFELASCDGASIYPRVQVIHIPVARCAQSFLERCCVVASACATYGLGATQVLCFFRQHSPVPTRTA